MVDKKISDITLEVLVSIRDEIKGLREDTNKRFERIEEDIPQIRRDMGHIVAKSDRGYLILASDMEDEKRLRDRRATIRSFEVKLQTLQRTDPDQLSNSSIFPLEELQHGSIPLNSFPNIEPQELGIAVQVLERRQLFGELDRFRL